ncbi:acyltransferase [Escherichia coli]|uniref:acyltransferase n=1 Tax=Escherichia coli TaxID=562 RepID=UPI000F63871E|nr:acyltransferase family protein [Escherichia coli]EFE8270768.1 acyltransferase family protein [Escherichia coli]EFN2435231.1 acyltransferase family protein [Escherichia coli]ELO4340957.1 acyltransferase family protein [Escherichia coli]RRL59828.1 acyltransferase [Escherichia coli]
MQWAYNLRVFAIFMVVVIHVTAGYVTFADTNPSFYGSTLWWSANILDSFSRWSVPVFVMLSGYFLINGTDSTISFYKKRMTRILIPVLAWTMIYITWTIFKSYIKGDLTLGVITSIKQLLAGKPYYHMWFLYMIPFLYIITPFLRKIITKSSDNEVTILIVICSALPLINLIYNNVVGMENNKPQFFMITFLNYIGYFVIGGVFRAKKTEKLCMCTIFTLISLIITAILAYKFGRVYFYDYLSLNVFISSVLIFAICSSINGGESLLSKKLASLTLGVYLIHPIFIELYSYLLRHLLKINAFSIVYMLFMIVVVFASSLAASLIISKLKYLNKII